MSPAFGNPVLLQLARDGLVPVVCCRTDGHPAALGSVEGRCVGCQAPIWVFSPETYAGGAFATVCLECSGWSLEALRALLFGGRSASA